MVTREERGWTRWVKGFNYLVMDGNQTCGGDHSEEYMDVEL